MLCLTSARFNMKADVLRQTAPDNTPIDQTGEWVSRQDPETGEIIRVWEPNTGTTDDPSTPADEGLETFNCIARGILDGGIRVAGTTERWNEIYDAVDYVRITFPARVRLSRRDRITNIRDNKGNIIWREEERADQAPTVFEVTGITPVVDPFGRHIENMALLERADTQ